MIKKKNQYISLTDFNKMAQLLEKNGMNKKIIKLFLKKWAIEEQTFTCDEDTRKLTMEKGFFPSRIELFGKEGIESGEYLSDFSDYMMHPYNNHFVIWINDKLSLKYTLGEKFSHIIPEYYLYIENDGSYTYLSDAPNNLVRNKEFVVNLLKEKKVLIIKPNSSSSGGLGVMKVEWRENGILINNKTLLSENEFYEKLKTCTNNIVTEYAHQHSALKEIWPDSECTLRIIMVKLPNDEYFEEDKWKCIVSYARFGTSISGGASNLSSGGIGIGFDFETGKLKEFGIRYKEFNEKGEFKCTEHPDSHVKWSQTTLPNWEIVKENLYRICHHYNSLSHLGFDVIITEKGFVLCEINSKPALNYEQIMNIPMLSENSVNSYFKSKGLEKIDNSKFYKIWKSSQIH